MRLWSVQTGKCLYRWEFPTAVKRVAFNEEDDQVVCITEQRMGHQGAIRVFNINREGDGTNRERNCIPWTYICLTWIFGGCRIKRPRIVLQSNRQQGCRLRIRFPHSHLDRPRIRQGSSLRCQDRRGGPEQRAGTHGCRHGSPALTGPDILRHK